MSSVPGDRRRRRATGSVRVVFVIVVGGLVVAGLAFWLLSARTTSPALSFETVVAEADLSSVPGQEARKFPKELDYKLALVDPAADGWDTEVFNGKAVARLAELGKALIHPGAIDESLLAAMAEADYESGPLRPRERRAVYESPSVKVLRAAAPGSGSDHHGPTGFSGALRELLEPYPPEEEVHTKLKISHVDPAGTHVSTEVLFQASGLSREGRLQQNATWRVDWVEHGDDPPKIARIDVEAYEEVLGPRDGEPLFVDVTEATLGSTPSYHRQFLPGQDHWGRSLDVAFGSQLLGHDGLAVSDVNGDGLEDLYVTQGGGLPNRLFVQRPDGTLEDVSARAGVDYLDITSSALLLDFDNDGDQDLVAATGPLVFHSNDGSGRFQLEEVVPTFSVYSLAAADFDNDGDLDLYACRYSSPEEDSPIPYYDANNGTPNLMLRNDGGWKFTDITVESGLDRNNRRYSFAASWADFDDDGDLDLYVANDFGRNNLYRNDGGRFTDVAADAGVEDISAGMSVSWGDYNGDGLLDVYISNMWSSAGNRTTYQRRFKQETESEIRGHYQRLARGNSLFENSGDGTFKDVSLEAGVTMGRWAWGSKFVDINNDGLEDIFVVNGYVTNDDPHDL